MSLPPFDSFQSRFVTYLLNFPRISVVSSLDWVGGQCHAPVALPPAKSPGTQSTGGWVVPWAGLDGYGKPKHAFKCVFRFSLQLLFEAFFIIRRNERYDQK